MKLIALLSLLFIVSCGIPNVVPQNNDGGGTIRKFDRLMTDDDKERIRSVCAALASKKERLPVLISSAYTFDYAHKGCNDQALGPFKQVNTSIRNSGERYFFERTDGIAFPFAEVETGTEGVLAVVCKKLKDDETDFKSPMDTGSTSAVWFTSNTSSENCAPTPGNLCVYLGKGTLVSGKDYHIHTQEWFKFQLLEGRKGFFIERKLLSDGDCNKGKQIEMRAVLK